MRNLPDKEREAILRELLMKPKVTMEVYTEIADGYGVSPVTIRRIWSSSKKQGVLMGAINIDVSSGLKRSGRPMLWTPEAITKKL
ncbi:hypothetical protein AC1031_002614, partial [Aphanomyces cochlioides]